MSKLYENTSSKLALVFDGLSDLVPFVLNTKIETQDHLERYVRSLLMLFYHILNSRDRGRLAIELCPAYRSFVEMDFIGSGRSGSIRRYIQLFEDKISIFKVKLQSIASLSIQSKLDIINDVSESVGIKYDESQSNLIDFLETGVGNCDVRARYVIGVLRELFPDLNIHLDHVVWDKVSHARIVFSFLEAPNIFYFIDPPNKLGLYNKKPLIQDPPELIYLYSYLKYFLEESAPVMQFDFDKKLAISPKSINLGKKQNSMFAFDDIPFADDFVSSVGDNVVGFDDLPKASLQDFLLHFFIQFGRRLKKIDILAGTSIGLLFSMTLGLLSLSTEEQPKEIYTESSLPLKAGLSQNAEQIREAIRIINIMGDKIKSSNNTQGSEDLNSQQGFLLNEIGALFQVQVNSNLGSQSKEKFVDISGPGVNNALYGLSVVQSAKVVFEERFAKILANKEGLRYKVALHLNLDRKIITMTVGVLDIQGDVPEIKYYFDYKTFEPIFDPYSTSVLRGLIPRLIYKYNFKKLTLSDQEKQDLKRFLKDTFEENTTEVNGYNKILE